MSYCPIHLHSCYSIRDAIIRVDKLAERCAELGIESCAITDHGLCSAAYKQFIEFKKHGIKSIIGCEFYLTDNAQEKNPHHHLILIAKNQEGYKNLCALNKYAYVDGFYRKPRIDWKALERFSSGIICTTACIFGLPQQQFLLGDPDAALDTIKGFKKIFGDDFYLEIANHELEDEDLVRPFFREVGNDLDIKIVAATDSHYLNKEDQTLHTIFKQLAYNQIKSGGISEDDGFPGNGYHLMSPDEMTSRFEENDLENTLEIADKCNVNFEFTGYHLPSAHLPSGIDSYEYLYSLANKGLKDRGIDTNPIYVERLRFEMEQLHLTELEDYFIIVYDYMKWTKEQKIPVGPGRGSAAGSLVSYLIGITGVDPIQYNLLFARCCNSGRALQYDFGIDKLKK